MLFAFYGLRTDGGINSINADDDESTKNPNIINNGLTSRFFLDMLFHLIVKGIIIVFMAAIVIASYINYNETNNKMEYEKKNICFICNINRDVFLRNKICFNKHIKKIHNKLDYIYYIIYLLTKKRNDLRKIDKYVLEKFIIGDLFWIPCNETFSLSSKEGNFNFDNRVLNE
jgi:hypothetical protein